MDFALGAVGLAGGAAAAAVPDEEMGKEGPVLLGDDFDECLLDFDGIVLAGETQPAGEAADMGVDDDALGEVEGIAEDDVGGLSAHAGELVEMFHGPRNFAAVVFDQGGGAAADGFGLGAEESGGADEAFELGGRDFSKMLGRGAALEKGGCDFVDPVIRALGGEDRGDEELEGILVVKFAMGVGVRLLKPGNDLAGSARKMG